LDEDRRERTVALAREGNGGARVGVGGQLELRDRGSDLGATTRDRATDTVRLDGADFALERRELWR
jgi:hypothetical protein